MIVLLRLFKYRLLVLVLFGAPTSAPGELGTDWTEATSHALWSRRGYFQAVSYNQKIWVLGSEGNIGPVSVSWSSDGVTWTPLPDPAGYVDRYGHTALVHSNRIWIMGGHSRGSLLQFLSVEIRVRMLPHCRESEHTLVPEDVRSQSPGSPSRS